MSGIADEPPGRIALEGGDQLGEQAGEIARVWINDEGRASVWIAAYRLEDPAMFGLLMADTVRHAALAYAAAWSIDEGKALQAIVETMGTELREQFGAIETIRPGSLN